MQYQINIDELMEFVSEKPFLGFNYEEIKIAEKNIGAVLPKAYCYYLRNYGKNKINYRYNNINPPNEIQTSYFWLQEIIEEQKEDFKKAQDNSLKDSVYFKLWQLTKDKWSSITDNYVLIWYENQGVWNASFKLSDLKKGIENPPVYISTNDDFISFAKCTGNIEDFLVLMLFEALCECNRSCILRDPIKIDKTLQALGVDIEQLKWKGKIALFFDEKQSNLYFYSKCNKEKELCIYKCN